MQWSHEAAAHSVRTLDAAANQLQALWASFILFEISVDIACASDVACDKCIIARAAWKRKKKLNENQLNGMRFNACVGQLYLVTLDYFLWSSVQLLYLSGCRAALSSLLFPWHFFFDSIKSKLTPNNARLTHK